MAWGGFKSFARRVGPPKPKSAKKLAAEQDMRECVRAMKSVIAYPQQVLWYWHSPTQLWIDIPLKVLAAHALPTFPRAKSAHLALCRKSVRAACLWVLDTNAFPKVERAAKANGRSRLFDKYETAIDSLQHVGLVRLTPVSKTGKGDQRFWPSLERDSLLEALHAHRDGAFDLAGFTANETGRITWHGQYLDSDNKAGSIGVVYNEIESKTAGLRVVYEFKVAMR